jgi:hypothetical protein
MNFDDCTEKNQNKIVPINESGRKFTINNPNRRTISKIKVDGCLIDDEGERCDYLFEVDEPITCAIYVELKGKDVPKAFSQLIATIGYLKKRHNAAKKECYIVCSRVPKTGTGVQELREKMKKECKATLIVKTDQYEIEI